MRDPLTNSWGTVEGFKNGGPTSVSLTLKPPGPAVRLVTMKIYLASLTGWGRRCRG